jgi:hypothetical protein
LPYENCVCVTQELNGFQLLIEPTLSLSSKREIPYEMAKIPKSAQSQNTSRNYKSEK